MRRLWLLSVLAVVSAVHAETLYVIEQVVVNVNSAPDASGERVATIKSGEAVDVLERQGDQIHVHLPNGTEGWVRKSYLSADEPLQHRLSERTAEVDKLKQDVARLESELAAARTGARGGKPGTTQAGPVSPGALQANNALASVSKGAASGAPANSAPAKGATNIAAAKGTQTNTPTSAASARAPATSPATSPPNASSSVASAAGEAPAQTNSPESDPATGEPAYFMTPPEAPARPVWHWALGSFIVALVLGYGLGWYVLDRRIRRKFGGLRIY